MRALRPGGPIRHLTIDGTLNHTRSIHLPLLFKVKLKHRKFVLFLLNVQILHNSNNKFKRIVPYLFTKFKVDRFAVTAHTVQHARFNATPTHSSLTQLACTPVFKINIVHFISANSTVSFSKYNFISLKYRQLPVMLYE